MWPHISANKSRRTRPFQSQVSTFLKRLLAQDMNVAKYGIETKGDEQEEDQIKDVMIVCFGIFVMILMLIFQTYSETSLSKFTVV